MENMLKDFRKWLADQEVSGDACSSMISRLNRISGAYDILEEYAHDNCEGLLDDLTYTAKDKKNGEEPKANIVIAGDYCKGFRSLKNALSRFINFLDSINYGVKTEKNDSINHAVETEKNDSINCAVEIEKKDKPSIFSGSFKEFNKYIGPRCRNEVQVFCKKERESHNGRCEYCGSIAILESAHITERPLIILDILEKNFKQEDDYYVVNLDKFFEIFKKAHEPIKEKIFFLCPDCHYKLDKGNELTADDIRKKRK